MAVRKPQLSVKCQMSVALQSAVKWPALGFQQASSLRTGGTVQQLPACWGPPRLPLQPRRVHDRGNRFNAALQLTRCCLCVTGANAVHPREKGNLGTADQYTVSHDANAPHLKTDVPV